MRTPKPTRALLAALVALGGLATLSNAQSVTTTPVGAVTYSIPANTTRGITVPLLESTSTQSGQTRGIITSVTSSSISNSNAGWTAGEFSNSTNPHYVRITSGAAVGRLFLISTTNNTATQLNLTTDSIDISTLGIVSGTDTYEIIPADTLSSLFGNDTMLGGDSAANADNVLVWNNTSYLVFYYNTLRSRWERDIDTSGSPTRDHFVLRPDRGIMIQRKGGTTLSFTLTGRVLENKFSPAHSTNGTSFVNYGFPVPVTLNGLNLQSQPGWKSWNDQATASANADLIQVWNNTSWLSFYYDSTNNRWQRAGVTDGIDRNSFSVAACVPLVITRTTNNANRALSFNIPYSL